jgi:UDP-glucose 4-epimerase
VLTRAAATGTAPDLAGIMAPPRAEDALDLCYVKDTARARTYNVGSGRATSNADVLAALAGVEPGFRFELPSAGPLPVSWLDITRLREDTGFEPAYDRAAAAVDYVAWFRAGHDA